MTTSDRHNSLDAEQLEVLNEALLALQSALLGRPIYGSEHPTICVQRDEAVRGLRTLLDALRRPIRVLLVDRRVVVGSQRLPSSEQLAGGVFARLNAGGVDGLVVTPGLRPDELDSLLAALPDDPSHPFELPNTPHLRPACIDDHESDAPPSPGLRSADDTRDAAEAFGPVWSAVADRGEPDHEQLGRLVEQIGAAVAVGADAMLPMADLKRHDEYTFVHTVNVGILAAGLAEAVGLSPPVVQDLTLAALLHDVGKKQTPLELLNKAGKLEEHELRIMRRHPADGARILFDAPGVPEIATVVAFEHHIKLDSSGYPSVRPGYRAHLGSQIVQLADVFDALRTHRPYRAALPMEKVKQIMFEDAGRHYDRDLLAVFFGRVVTRSSREQDDETPPVADAA